MGAWNLSPWTTREVPGYQLLTWFLHAIAAEPRSSPNRRWWEPTSDPEPCLTQQVLKGRAAGSRFTTVHKYTLQSQGRLSEEAIEYFIVMQIQ